MIALMQGLTQPYILVVEDDVEIREALCMALESGGYNLHAVGDGKEALELLQSQRPPFLILLDLMLPEMSGWELIEELKKDPSEPLASIPVVITSAAGEAAQSAVEKAQGYLKKPILLPDLFSTVSRFANS